MPREHDPMLETLDRVHAEVCTRIQQVAAGEESKRALDTVRAQLRALAVAESAVLYPAFTKVTLRPETAALLDDIHDYRDAQLAGLDEMASSKRPHLRKLRALRLCDLIMRDATTVATQLIAVLRCQMPRLRYAALGRAFAAQVAVTVIDVAPANVSASVLRAV